MFLGQPWVYWVGAVVAAGLMLAPPICDRLERRAERRDRECWARVPGSVE